MRQDTQPARSDASRPVPPPEVLEEYKFIAESLANTTERRQRTNDVYVGVNALFLSGIGFLLAASHFDSWRTAIEVGAITAVIAPLNGTWCSAVAFYGRAIVTHVQCLVELEGKYQFAADLSTRLQSSYPRFGRSRAVAYYFLGLYPAIAVAVVVLTYLVTQHVI
jgi:hypothetical protein